LVLNFIPIKEALEFPVFLCDKRSIANRLYKIYNTSFMPINFVFEFYTYKRSIGFPGFLGDKRSIENKLNKI